MCIQMYKCYVLGYERSKFSSCFNWVSQSYYRRMCRTLSFNYENCIHHTKLIKIWSGAMAVEQLSSWRTVAEHVIVHKRRAELSQLGNHANNDGNALLTHQCWCFRSLICEGIDTSGALEATKKLPTKFVIRVLCDGTNELFGCKSFNRIVLQSP